ncbi:MAG: hypothetical protein F4X83_02755 [Chloroflexi bacterium]|nr:hypothetical protein [Chloroflexota bacterium]
MSVFLALILLGTSLLTVSAHTGDPEPKKYVLVTVEIDGDKGIDADNPANINDKLDIIVTVYRIGDHSTSSGALVGPDTDGAVTEDDAATVDDLTDTNGFEEVKLKYTIRATDLGEASARTATLTWTYNFTATDGNTANDHTTQSVTGTVKVYVAERGPSDPGASEVTIDFGEMTDIEPEKGTEIQFKAMVTTGQYAFAGKSFLIMKQYYNADDEKDGALLPFTNMVIPALGDNATLDDHATAPAKPTLSQRDINIIEAGGKIVFSYKVDINEADIIKAGSTDRVDINGDGNIGQTDADPPVGIAVDGTLTDIATHDKVETLENANLLTLPIPVPEPEATPSPYLFESEAAKVMETGAGSAIEIHRLDIETTPITLLLGSRSASGTLLPQASGYIRDASRGQTYAVVRRADGEVRRAWISSTNEWVSHVPWNDVIAFYNVPAAVLNVVPLDGSMPEAEQLVDVAGTWYVYRAGAWRHIPNLSTFRAEGFFWCDLTTANADFFDREGAPVGTPLAARVGPPDEGYPECRGM